MFTRRATALGAVAAALTVGLGGGVADASTRTAAKPVVSLRTYEVALPAKGAVTPYWGWSANARHVDATDAVLTVDARGLAKVAKVVFSSNCTAHGLVASCQEWFQGDSTSVPQGISGTTQLQISALPGAKPGATGSYKVTGASGSVTIAGATVPVTVGGPDYRLAPMRTDLGKFALNSVVSEPVGFTNVGNRPANGSRVLFFASPGLTFATHYANCRYGRAPWHLGHPVASVALCTFPGVMRVGEQVALAQPLRVRLTAHALFEEVQGDVGPAGDSEEWNWLTAPGSTFVWTQGKGPVLGLKVLKAGHRVAASAGTAQIANSEGHDFISGVTARNTADFGTTGSLAKAVRGGTVTVKLTLSNHGPADLTSAEGAPGLEFTPPPGTTVVGPSSGCVPDWSPKVPGQYYCYGGDWGQLSGTTLTYSLTLRVDQVIKGATGTVRVRYPVFAPGQNPYAVWYDPNTRNNSALIKLT